jgi:hypothetical protein
MRGPMRHDMGGEMANNLALMSVMCEYFGWLEARDHLVAAMRAIPNARVLTDPKRGKHAQRSHT